MNTIGLIILVASLALWFVMMMVGLPLYLAFLVGALPVLVWLANQGTMGIGKLATDSVWSFTLICIPLFILMGNTMSASGATEVLFDAAKAYVGHIPGGLGMAAIVASAMFGAMCGSSIATALAIGAIALPELQKAGYSRETVAAITGSAGGLGLLIPPSIDFVILGVLLKVSVGDLFIAGIIPGIMTMVLLSITCYFWIRRKKEVKVSAPYSWRMRGKATVRVLPLVIMPLAIAGSLWGGICTPTEAAGVGCFVAFMLAIFYFRRFGWTELKKCTTDTVRSSAAIFCVILGAVIFGRALAFLGIPQMAGRYIGTLGLEISAFKFLFFGVFFFLGMVFDFFVLIFVCLPPVIPLLTLYNISLVPFGVVFSMVGFIGQLTPPVAITLYAASTGTGASGTGAIREATPFLLAWVVATLIMLFVPAIAIY